MSYVAFLKQAKLLFFKVENAGKASTVMQELVIGQRSCHASNIPFTFRVCVSQNNLRDLIKGSDQSQQLPFIFSLQCLGSHSLNRASSVSHFTSMANTFKYIIVGGGVAAVSFSLSLSLFFIFVFFFFFSHCYLVFPLYRFLLSSIRFQMH